MKCAFLSVLVAACAVPCSSVATGLQQVYMKEHNLRLQAEKLVHKLSGVLNTTSSALQSKDQQLALEEQTTKVLKEQNVRDSEERDELKAVKDHEALLERNLQAATAALDKEKEVSNTLHEQESVSASHNWEMMNDLHRVMTDERTMRLASQANASQLESKFESSEHDRERLSSELTQSRESLVQKDRSLSNITSTLEQAHRDIANLHQQLEHAEKINEEKDANITKEINTIAEVREEGKNMDLQRQKQLDEKEQKYEKEAKDLKEEDQAAIANLTQKNQELDAAKLKLEQELSQESQKIQSMEKTTAAQQNKEEQTSQELAKAQAKISLLPKIAEKMKALTQANLQLKHAYQEQTLGLNQAVAKLELKSKALDNAHDVVTKTAGQLQAENEAKQKSDAKMRQMLELLREKNAQLQVQQQESASSSWRLKQEQEKTTELTKKLNDSQSLKSEIYFKDRELEELHKQTDALKSEDEAKDTTLKALHEELADASKTKEELIDARAKLNASNAQEQELVDQLAVTSQQTQDQLVMAGTKEAALQKQLDDMSRKLAAATSEKEEILAASAAKERELKAELDQRMKDEAAAKQKQTEAMKNLNATTHMEKQELKVAKNEQETLTQEMMTKNKALEESRAQRAQLSKKLEKISAALVKEHSETFWEHIKEKQKGKVTGFLSPSS